MDQHGFTDQLFGLCHLLGFTLMPRLNVSKQTLYKLDRATSYGPLDDVITSTVDTALIREQWDQLVRVAASLRNRTAPAHVVLRRLASSAPSDRLAKALTALGRALRSLYLLRGPDHGTGHLAPSGAIPRLGVVDSTVLGVDQRIVKSRQTSNTVSDRKTAPPRLCRLHA